MMRITWDSSGMEARLAGLSSALSDLRPVWPTVHDIVIKFFRAIFTAQGGYPRGERWQALSPAYAAWKARHYPGQPILQMTGHLAESMEGGPDHIYRFGPSWMETGTQDIKARTHQWGYTGPLFGGRVQGTIPARPIIQRPSRAEGERIVDAVLAYLFHGARRVR